MTPKRFAQAAALASTVSGPLKAIVLPPQARFVAARSRSAFAPREFPEARTAPTLPLTIRDELLELYALKFCQGGFRRLGMTFEQFLLVAAAVKPRDVADAHGDAESVRVAARETLR